MIKCKKLVIEILGNGGRYVLVRADEEPIGYLQNLSLSVGTPDLPVRLVMQQKKPGKTAQMITMLDIDFSKASEPKDKPTLEEVLHLFHTAWGNAKDGEYDKRIWNKLQQALNAWEVMV